MAVINDITVEILRNRGVPVRIHKLRKVDGAYVEPYERLYDDDGFPLTTVLHIQFTNWVIANMEDIPPSGFGSLEAWNTQLHERSFRTAAATVAHIVDEYTLDPKANVYVPNMRLAAALLLDGEMSEYILALTNAMYIAQGVVSPEALAGGLDAQVQALRKGIDSVNEGLLAKTEDLEKELAKMFESDENDSETTPTDPNEQESESTQSSPSSKDGQPSTEVSMSSGA